MEPVKDGSEVCSAGVVADTAASCTHRFQESQAHTGHIVHGIEESDEGPRIRRQGWDSGLVPSANPLTNDAKHALRTLAAVDTALDVRDTSNTASHDLRPIDRDDAPNRALKRLCQSADRITARYLLPATGTLIGNG